MAKIKVTEITPYDDYTWVYCPFCGDEISFYADEKEKDGYWLSGSSWCNHLVKTKVENGEISFIFEGDESELEYPN